MFYIRLLRMTLFDYEVPQLKKAPETHHHCGQKARHAKWKSPCGELALPGKVRPTRSRQAHRAAPGRSNSCTAVDPGPITHTEEQKH